MNSLSLTTNAIYIYGRERWNCSSIRSERTKYFLQILLSTKSFNLNSQTKIALSPQYDIFFLVKIEAWLVQNEFIETATATRESSTSYKSVDVKA